MERVPLSCFLCASVIAAGTQAQQLVIDTTCWQLGGSGRAVLEDTVRNRIFIGGDFSSVLYPATMPFHAELDAATGMPVRPSLEPDAPVRCSVPDGAGGWYIGGEFTQVAGHSRSRLAHLLPDGSLDTWNPVVNGPVKALLIKGDTLYFGGGFSVVNGVVKSNLAAVRLSTGTNVPFGQAFANDTVRCMALSSGRLYVGGDFTQMNGMVRSRIASFTVSNHALTTWAPVVGSRVHCLLADPTAIHIGGEFTNINGMGRSRIARLDPTANTVMAWNPNANSTVRCMAQTGGYFFLGGDFIIVGGITRNHIACVSSGASATPIAWSKDIDGPVMCMAITNNTVYVGGDFDLVDNAGRRNLAAFGIPGTAVPSTTDWTAATSGRVWSIAAHGTSLHISGNFSLCGLSRRGIAALDQATGLPLPWNPDINGEVQALAQAADGTLYAAGSFSTAGGTSHLNLVALDPLTGDVLPWNASANLGIVNSIQISGDTLVACGTFGMLSGALRTKLGAVSRTTGSALPWNVQLGLADEPSKLLLRHDTLYICGKITTVGGQSRTAVAAIDLSSATVLPFAVNCTAGSEAHHLALSGSSLFVGGATGTWGGTTTADPDLGSFKLNAATGNVQPWPLAYSHAVAAGGNKVYHSSYGTSLGTLDVTSGEVLGRGLGLITAGSALVVSENGDLLSAGTYYFGQDMPFGFLRARSVPSVSVKVMLDGPFDTGTMRDDLSENALLPLTEPYTALGYTHTGGGGGESASSNINSTYYDIVDWAILEYRDANDPSVIVASQSVLLHTDGRLRSTDFGGLHPFAADNDGSYYVAVRHRNHLGVMTAQPVDFSTSPFIDFSLPATPVFGNTARKTNGGTGVLWSGDVNFDGTIKYTGNNNDRDPVLVRIGGTVPTNTAAGYFTEDVNMDGQVKYTGNKNDRDPILVNIGGTVPTNVREEQLP